MRTAGRPGANAANHSYGTAKAFIFNLPAALEETCYGGSNVHSVTIDGNDPAFTAEPAAQ